MKLWSGRFGKSTDQLVDDFHSSISFDQRLFEQDITGSVAHATMLGEQGIIPKEDADKIVEGLRGILEDAREGKIARRFLPSGSARRASACTPAAAGTTRWRWTPACTPGRPVRRRKPSSGS